MLPFCGFLMLVFLGSVFGEKKAGDVIKKEIESKAGESVSINCNPPDVATKITWKMGRSGISSDINSTTDSRFSFEKVGKRDNGILKIKDVTYDDRNNYLCFIKMPAIVNGSLTTNATTIVKDFRLRVRDPLGAVWPTIGIIVEAIVLFIILFISEFCSKRPVITRVGTSNSLSSLRRGNRTDVTYGSFRGTEEREELYKEE